MNENQTEAPEALPPTADAGGDYDYLVESKVDENTTAEYEFDRVRGRPILLCAPATHDNRDWLAMVAEDAASMRVRKQKYEEMTDAQKKAEEHRIRLRDAKVLAKTCVKGFVRPPILRYETPPTLPGTTPISPPEPRPVFAKFSAEAAHKFLESLAIKAPNIFDLFRFWCSNSGSFVRVSFEAIEETAGNSGGG